MQTLPFEAPSPSSLSTLFAEGASPTEYPGVGASLRPLGETLAAAAAAQGRFPAEAGRLLFLPLCTAIVESVVHQDVADLASIPRVSRARVLEALRACPQPWHVWLPSLLTVAREYVSVADYAVLEMRAQEIARLQTSIELAAQLEASVGPLARAVAVDFVAFCRIEDEVEREIETLAGRVEAFLRTVAASLCASSELETRLEVCGWWAAHMVGRYECSRQEWQFLVAMIEQKTYEQVGPAPARLLSKFLDPLQASIARFPFVASMCQNASAILSRVTPLAGVDGQMLLHAVAAEVLLSCSESRSPLQSLLCRGRSSRAEVEVFARQLMEACRPLCERAWLDWLDGVLSRMRQAAAFAEARAAATKEVQAVVADAAADLREALGVFENSETLETSLLRKLDAAWEATLLFPAWTEAQLRWRAWVVQTFVLREGLEVSQHAKTVVRALRTSIRRSAASPLWEMLPTALDLLDLAPEIAGDCRDLVAAWETLASATSEQRLYADRVALDAARYGRASSRQTEGWLLDVGLALGGDWPSIIEQADAPPLTAAFRRVAASAPRAVVSRDLWTLSDDLGAAVSAGVYEAMPEYAERTGGDAGRVKCARDVAITLRRVARGFEPQIDDAEEFVAVWWSSLIDSYIANRPTRLFRVTLECLLAACRRRFSPAQVELVDAVVRPLYEAATTDDAAIPSSGAFQLVEWRPELGDAAEDAAAVAADEALARLMGAAQGPALDYASGFSFEGADAARLHARLRDISRALAEGLPAFEWLGMLSVSTCEAWSRLLSEEPSVIPCVERMLVGLILNAERGLVSLVGTLRCVDYLQATVEFVRQASAGAELEVRHREMGQWVAAALQTGDDAAEPQLCAFFLALARAMRRLPRPLARVEAGRAVAELVAPHACFREPAWSRVRELALTIGQPLFSASGWREASSWLTDMGNGGRRLPFIGAVSRAVLVADEPLFSPDPAVEQQWRQAIGCVLALLALRWTSPSESPTLRAQVAATLPLAREEGFPDQLRAVGEYVSGNIDAVDVSAFVDEITAVAAATVVARRPAAFPEIDDGRQWVALARATLAGTASRWGIPGALRAMSPAALERLAALPPLRWRVMLETAPALRLVREVLDRLPEVAAVWSGLDGDPFAGLERGAAREDECRRDLMWMARRVAVDAWGETGAAHWYTHEVMPFVGPMRQRQYADCVREACDRLQGHPRVSDAVAAAAREFRAAVLARLLTSPQGEAWLSPPPSPMSLRSVPSELARWLASAVSAADDELTSSRRPEIQAILVGGFGPYASYGVLSPRTTHAWRSVVAAAPSAAESLLVQLLRQVDLLPTLEMRLRAVDYLQALVEQTRQASVGLALDDIVDESSNEVVEVGLAVLGDALQSLPAPLAALHMHTWAAMAAGETVLEAPEAWQTALEQAAAAAAGVRGIMPWLRQLAAATPAIARSAAVMRTLRSSDELLAGTDEATWRTLVIRALALSQLREAAPVLADAAAVAVAGACRLAQPETVGERLEQLQARMREWFLDLDLRPVFFELASLHRALRAQHRLQGVRSQADELGRRMRERLPALVDADTSGLLVSLATRTAARGVETRWGIPAAAFVGEDMLARFAALGPDDLERALAALRNALAPWVADEAALEVNLQELRDLAARLAALSSTWDAPLDTRIEAGVATDLRWMSRRVAVEAWSGRRSADAVLEWYAYEVLPFQPQRGVEKPMKAMLDRQAASGESAQAGLVRDVAARLAVLQRTGATVEEALEAARAADVDKPRGLWGRLAGLVGGR